MNSNETRNKYYRKNSEKIKHQVKQYGRTYNGLITRMYCGIKQRSKRYNNNQLGFTKEEFVQWVSNQQELFDILWNNWIQSDYDTKLKPSINRLNDYKSYTFDNMELTTWEDNFNKGTKCIKTFNAHSCVSRNNGKMACKSVIQFDVNDDYLNKFSSITEAAKILHLHKESISACFKGIYKTAGGYKWQYTTVIK